MNLMRCSGFAIVLAVAALLSACEPTTTLTLTGPPQPPRAATCDFQMLTALPARGFIEIGTIDYQATTRWSYAYTLGEFKDRIQSRVCRAGGDAVFATVGPQGLYSMATVLKATPASSPSPAPANSEASTGGCQFDTQCKGNRICVKGECVDPEKK